MQSFEALFLKMWTSVPASWRACLKCRSLGLILDTVMQNIRGRDLGICIFSKFPGDIDVLYRLKTINLKH